MAPYYKSTRPQFSISITKSSQLRNCYSSTLFKVVSIRPLSSKILSTLNEIGILGFGQEFYIHSKCDGMEECSVFDEQMCVDDETGEMAIDSRTGKPYGSARIGYFVYECESRVDSSD